MATRGRRSCGDSVSLNPAMIHLLDIARLRKELESRGLDTKGNKLTLADRLEEAVRLGKSTVDGTSSMADDVPPPVKATAAKRTPISKKNDEKLQTPIVSDSFLQENLQKTPTMSTRKRKAGGETGKKPIKSLKIVWASEAPIDAIEKVESTTPATTSLLTPEKSVDTTPTLSEPEKQSAKKPSVMIGADGDAAEAMPSETDESIAGSGVGLPAKKKSVVAIDTAVSVLPDMTSPIPPATVKSTPSLIMTTRKGAAREAQKIVSEATTATKSISSSAPTLTDAVPAALSSAVVIEVTEKKQRNIEKRSERKLELVSTKPTKKEKERRKEPVNKEPKEVQDSNIVALDVSTGPAESGKLKDLTMESTAQVVPEKKTSPTAAASLTPPVTPSAALAKSTPIATPSSAAAVKKTLVTVRTPQLPQRVTAGNIDLLDNIFSQQDQLLADKYKSEQEKAMEKNLFELQKRRNLAATAGSVASMSPKGLPPASLPAKRAYRSVDGGELDEYLPPVVGFNNRDPLNLRELEPLSDQTTFSSPPQSTSSWSGGGDVHERYSLPNSAPIASTVGRFAAAIDPITKFPAVRAERQATFSDAPPITHPPSPTNALLLSPPPLPPATLIPPPPPPKPRQTVTINEPPTIEIVVPPPPPSRPKSTGDSIGSSNLKASLSPPPTLIPPPPPPKIRAPATTSRDEFFSCIVVPPPPPPKIVESGPSTTVETDVLLTASTPSPPPPIELIFVPPPPPPLVIRATQTPSVAPLSPVAKDIAQPLTLEKADRDDETTTTVTRLFQTPADEQKVSAIVSTDDQIDDMTNDTGEMNVVNKSDGIDASTHKAEGPAPVVADASLELADLVTVAIEKEDEPTTKTAEIIATSESVQIAVSNQTSEMSEAIAMSQASQASLINEVFQPTGTSQEKAPEGEPNSNIEDDDGASWPAVSITSPEPPAASSNVENDDQAPWRAVAVTPPEPPAVEDLVEPASAAADDETEVFNETEVFDPTKMTAVGDTTLNETIASSVGGREASVKVEPSEMEDDLSSLLLKDPKALLKRATDVLKQINESENNGDSTISHSRYDQLELDTTDYVMEEEEKPLPDFHGEPVPDDEDDDDILFEIAAGLRPANKKRDSVPSADADEPLPDDEFVELDYYNADMNIKASANNKWMIDPDNQDGFALMWGGVKSNYGILVSDAFDEPPPYQATTVASAGAMNDEDEDGGPRPSCSQASPATATRIPRLLPKRIAYQIKIVEFLSLKHVPFEELEPHDVRIGWSAANTSNMVWTLFIGDFLTVDRMKLGESNQSYMFCSNARKANANVFMDYGDPFHVNDVITTVLDFEKHEILYYKNGEKLGVAFSNVDFPVGTVVFPHIATKNCKVLVNFGYDDLPDTENADDWNLPAEELPPEDEEYRPMSVDHEEEDDEEYNGAVMIGLLQRRSGLLVASRRPPPDKTHCTVIAMVGLPGAGKTTWVKNYLLDHPEEHWVLFNTDTVLNAMTVNGMSRRRVHQGRWDMVMGLTAKAVNRSLQMACRRRHNYIIDQTNVSREGRKKKLTQFADFQRKCVVILPPDDELERRNLRQVRQEGSAGQIPVGAMLELKGAMSIPCTETEPIEDVLFVEPPMERLNEAIDLVKRYNEEGRPWIRRTHVTKKPESIISDCRNDMSNPWMSGPHSQRSSRNHDNSNFKN